MKYRRFGKTDLEMPVFSCGGMRYQHKWSDIEWSEVPDDGQKNLEATIHRAVEVGINHIETARGYGSSEMQLGPVLKKLPRKKLIVQTKVAPFANPREFLETFQKSLDYLQLDHVDLLSLHGINNQEILDWSLGPTGCVAAARWLQKEGRVRHVGFSTHATTDLILKAIESDAFDYVNLHWYFVNDLNWPAIEASAARDMGVFIISPNDKGGKLYAPPPKLTELCEPLHPMQFNDLYCLNRPQVHTLSCGAAKPSDFDCHLDALEHYDAIEPAIASIEKRLHDALAEAHGADWCARWPEGLPHYVDVPGELNLTEILRLWTYAKGLDLVDWGKMRYNLLGQGDHWFPGEHVGKLDVIGLTEALRKSPFANRIPEILTETHRLLLDTEQKRQSESE
ncbi:MAG: aldo/keto reductase [Verrucomicrobiales bacterium]|nr:aldo/keto reductase [Verrucomicrobiales bacterium]MBT5846147.1 aldo/keto reductase [Verrucomicrobiales bacterium]